MNLDVVVNGAVSARHVAWIQWLTRLIRIGLETMNSSIIPAFYYFFISIVSVPIRTELHENDKMYGEIL